MPKAKEQGEQSGSLVGLWGHLYEPDTETPRGTIRYQFKVVRRIDGGRYVVQMFSFVDGGLTEVKVFSEEELLGHKVKLYATKELWSEAYERDYERKWKLYEDTEAGRLT